MCRTWSRTTPPTPAAPRTRATVERAPRQKVGGGERKSAPWWWRQAQRLGSRRRCGDAVGASETQTSGCRRECDRQRCAKEVGVVSTTQRGNAQPTLATHIEAATKPRRTIWLLNVTPVIHFWSFAAGSAAASEASAVALAARTEQTTAGPRRRRAHDGREGTEVGEGRGVSDERVPKASGAAANILTVAVALQAAGDSSSVVVARCLTCVIKQSGTSKIHLLLPCLTPRARQAKRQLHGGVRDARNAAGA